MAKSKIRSVKTNKIKKNQKLQFASKFRRATLIIFALAFANIGALTLIFTQAATGYTGYSWTAETDQFNRINQERNRHGTKSVVRSKCLTNIARDWARYMGNSDKLAHSSGSLYYGSRLNECTGGSWSGGAENVGRAYVANNSSSALISASSTSMGAYLNSTGHHQNIDNPGYDFVGTGAYVKYSPTKGYNQLWTVHVYADCNGCGGTWSLYPGSAGEPTADTTSAPAPAPPAPEGSTDRFGRGTKISAGKAYYSSNGRYKLVMQSDGNLVLYYLNPTTAVWSTGTWGNKGAYAVFQSDGNFVVYRPGKSACHTATNGKGGTVMIVQGDGNLVMYGGGKAIWDSKGYTNNGFYC